MQIQLKQNQNQQQPTTKKQKTNKESKKQVFAQISESMWIYKCCKNFSIFAISEVSYAWLGQTGSLGPSPDLGCSSSTALERVLNKPQQFSPATASRTLALVLPLPFSSSELKTAACGWSKGAKKHSEGGWLSACVSPKLPSPLLSHRPERGHSTGSAVFLREGVGSPPAALFAVSRLSFAARQDGTRVGSPPRAASAPGWIYRKMTFRQVLQNPALVAPKAKKKSGSNNNR